jgi:SOS-response transcriptional repressor LexA
MKNKHDNKNLGELANLSDRLSHALKTLQITQADLSRQINVKPQAIQYLCNSKAKKSGFTYEIADALGINSTWLATGEGSMISEDDPKTKLIQSQKRIPVIKWLDIGKWVDQGLRNTMQIHDNEWILISSETSDRCFALRLHDKSMFPRFDLNTILIIDPDRSPQHKNFVIVRINKTEEILFRQYEKINSVIRLNPMNTEIYKTITLKNEDIIHGVMVEARWQL